MKASEMNFCHLPKNIKEMFRRLPTPFFLFDLDRVEANLRLLTDALSPDRVHYAVKCNRLPPILARWRLRPARRISSNTVTSPSIARFWGWSPTSRRTCAPKTSGDFGLSCGRG